MLNPLGMVVTPMPTDLESLLVSLTQTRDASVEIDEYIRRQLGDAMPARASLMVNVPAQVLDVVILELQRARGCRAERDAAMAAFQKAKRIAVMLAGVAAATAGPLLVLALLQAWR